MELAPPENPERTKEQCAGGLPRRSRSSRHGAQPRAGAADAACCRRCSGSCMKSR